MSIVKCKMCGAPLEIEQNVSICTCDYCGTVQTVPKFVSSDKINQLFERANQYRMKNEFDKAAGIYETIIAESPDEPEAYWGICLSTYGIEYVEDPKTGSRVPTCHRASYKSILDDPNYMAVLERADENARKVYAKEAVYIDSLQKNIIQISANEEPYDIFICYKETDADGNRTKDSVIAQEIYNALTEKGYKVFFSRITLKGKLGTAFEPYIFSALNSSRAMLVVGTSVEYINAVWVKNEWSRYLSLIEQGQKKILIPCYRDITPRDLPSEFAALQAQDVSQLGYLQDLTGGIEKCIGPAKAAEQSSELSNVEKQLAAMQQSLANMQMSRNPYANMHPAQNQFAEPVYNQTDGSPRYVGLGKAVKLFFKNYVNFKGRSTRSEFWFAGLFMMLVYIVLGIFGGATDSSAMESFVGIFSLVCVIPSLSLSIRRLHDTDKSGWCVLVTVIPFFGWIIAFMWACQQSYPISNKWGDPADPNKK